ncbi:MAG TPA: tRNA pseudouridine(38-40) synthase TruA [Bacteroidia bacterium]|nr:tRNA pseudouridine(38-40) synthase TruA [Bacteroidia bacterium]
MPRYFLEFCFKGTHYSGWQIQDNAVSVQEKINRALSVLLNTEIETIGCGRTDAGVHAKQFFAQFDSANEINDKYKFVHQLNSLLPNDISIFDFYPVKEAASVRFNAISRTYEYYLCRGKNPFLKEYVAAMFYDVDVPALNEACKILSEYNDFKCFSKSRTQVKHTICKISEAKWEEKNGFHKFTISANRFLRGMVRAIVGTLLQIGKRDLTLEDFKKIIENKERSAAGASVDACGLYLSKIEYPYLKIDREFEFPFDVRSQKSEIRDRKSEIKNY